MYICVIIHSLHLELETALLKPCWSRFLKRGCPLRAENGRSFPPVVCVDSFEMRTAHLP
jgi:hypothetical protein